MVPYIGSCLSAACVAAITCGGVLKLNEVARSWVRNVGEKEVDWRNGGGMVSRNGNRIWILKWSLRVLRIRILVELKLYAAMHNPKEIRSVTKSLPGLPVARIQLTIFQYWKRIQCHVAFQPVSFYKITTILFLKSPAP